MFQIQAFLVLVLFAVSGWGQTTGTTGISTNTKLVGLSNYFHKVTSVSANEVTVFAGNTATSCSSTSNSSPCDSCAALAGTPISSTAGADLVCNQKQIHPSLDFQVTLSHPNAAVYVASCASLIAFKVSGDTGALKQAVANSISYTPNVGGQNVTATFKWSQICEAIGATADCDASTEAKSLEFGFNSSCGNSALVDIGLKLNLRFRYVNRTLGFMTFPCEDGVLEPQPYEGVCSFNILRGDAKAYVLVNGATFSASNTLPVPDSSGTVGAAGSSTDRSGMVYDTLRIFCKPVSGALHSTLTTSNVCADLKIDGNTISDGRVQGLANGVQYEFLAANVDEAGNVSYFSDPAAVGTLGVATPAQVYGLLDETKCFVATAAFGSPMAPKVQRLRQFRDQYLLTNPWGKKLVEVYYDHSPEFARWIAKNEARRALARVALAPFILVAELFLQLGLWIYLLPVLIGCFAYTSRKWFYAR